MASFIGRLPTGQPGFNIDLYISSGEGKCVNWDNVKSKIKQHACFDTIWGKFNIKLSLGLIEHNLVLKPAVSMFGCETRKWAGRAWVGTVSYDGTNIRHQQRTAYGNIAQYTAPLYLVLCCHVVGRLGKAAPFAPNESVAAKALCDDTNTDTRNFSAQSQVLLIH